jgi:hypothetical protein
LLAARTPNLSKKIFKKKIIPFWLGRAENALAIAWYLYCKYDLK